MIVGAFSPQTQQLIANPLLLGQYINLFLIGKVIVLILAVLYVIFAVRVWVQIRRLESWLPSLQGHGYGGWALAHLLLALVGLILALLVL